jgi:hypothetical protein
VKSWKLARKTNRSRENRRSWQPQKQPPQNQRREPDNPDLTVRIGQHVLTTRIWQHFRAQKENGRLRMCANSHYRIVTANPPNRNAAQHAVQLAKQRLARQRCLSIFRPEAGLVGWLS